MVPLSLIFLGFSIPFSILDNEEFVFRRLKMANRTPQKPSIEQPAADASTPRVWGWLQNPANQKTLRFIGAGIVAVIGLLGSIGFFHTSTKTEQFSSASQALPAAPTQSAVASGGNATNIQGNKNQVSTKP
jgi:hypothetical protein